MKNFKSLNAFRVIAALCCLLMSAPAFAQNITVKNGEKIAFLGDSITQQGATLPLGYVRLVISGLDANGIKAEPIYAGVSGHKSNDMLARLDRDVISKKSDWMTLSCGVNDVWHGERGVALEPYKANITAIVDKAQAANIKVMILVSTLIYEDVNHPLNQAAIQYNDFLRTLAKERNLTIADLNADMRAVRATLPEADQKRSVMTVDGIHMNDKGNMLMATGVLRAFGLNDAQLEKAREAWQDLPKAAPIKTNVAVTLRQYEQLQKVAAAQNRSFNDLVNEQLQKYLDSLIASAPAQ